MARLLKADLSKESGLSKAVSRVFEYKAVGNTSQQVADLLYRSIKTIDTQTTAYLQALECKNTQEAIAKTVAEGLLTFRYISKSILLVICISSVSNEVDSLRNRNKSRSCRCYSAQTARKIEQI